MQNSTLISMILVSSYVSAQSVSQLDLEACLEFDNEAQRLACFEELTARGRSAEDTAITNTPSAVTDTDTVPAPCPSGRSEPAVATTPAARNQVPRVSTDPGIEQIGKRAEDVEPDTVVATVVDVTTGGFNHLYFHMDNGSVWRQVEARYFPYPRSGSFDVEISRGVLGEYQLRVEGRGRMVRIRRVE